MGQNYPDSQSEAEFVDTQQDIDATQQDITTAQQDIQTAKEDIQAVKQDIQTVKQDIRNPQVDLQTTVEDIQTTGQDIQAAGKIMLTVRKDMQVVEKDLKIVERDLQIVEKDVKPFTDFVLKFNNDWSFIMASALAFHILTAMFPMIFSTLAFLGLFIGKLDGPSQQKIIEQIITILPGPLSSNDIIRTIFHQLPRLYGNLGVLAVIVAIFGGSRLFVLLEECFDLIYRVRPRSILRQNLVALGMLLLFIILIPIMIYASSEPARVVAGLSLRDTLEGKLLVSIVGVVSSFVISLVLFQAIYMIVPNQKISFRNSWLGTVVASIALQIYLVLFPFYLTYLLNSYLGQVGFALILLIFFYYFAVILLLGAQVNAYYAEDIRATLKDLPTLVFEAAQREKQLREQNTTVAQTNPSSK